MHGGYVTVHTYICVLCEEVVSVRMCVVGEGGVLLVRVLWGGRLVERYVCCVMVLLVCVRGGGVLLVCVLMEEGSVCVWGLSGSAKATSG